VIENLQRLSQTATHVTTSLAAGVVKVDELTSVRSILAATDPSLFGRLSALNPSFIEQVWESRTPAYRQVSRITDANQRQQLKALGVQTWLLVPIQSQVYFDGMLIVALTDRSLFIDDDLDMLELLTQECILILDNHRLIEELQGTDARWGVQVKQRRKGMSVLSRQDTASQVG